MHRHGIQQFIRENDAAHRRQRSQVMEPTHFALKLSQGIALPFQLPLGRLNNPVLNRFEESRPVLAQPLQNIARKITVMGASLHKLKCGRSPVRAFVLPFRGFEPFGKLKRQQFTENFSNAYAREKIPVASNSVLFLLVKSKIRTVKGHPHELREADYPSVFDFRRDPFSEFVQKKMFGADLAIKAATKRSIWQRLMHFST
jgi:hypothetical protein